MSNVLLPGELTSEPQPALQLLVELTPWRKVFFSNLRDLVLPRRLPRLQMTSAPAPFWPDVFVKRGLPWRRFLESGGYHVLALALLVLFSRFLALQPQLAPSRTLDHAEVIYYQPAEYLPPLDTRSSDAGKSQKADPEFSRQPIISVPPEAGNHSQTIVTPPNIKLKHDVPLPNIVAWSDKPQLPIAPAPLVPASSLSRLNPNFDNSVVAPPPDLAASAKTAFQAPQPAVVEPPPNIESTVRRPIGELNIGRSSVIAPAPQLPRGEQYAISGASSASAGMAPQVVPPPPSVGGSGSSAAGGRVIALNLHPALGAPPNPPEGNRRGSFAATPEGHAGASGNPGAISGGTSGGTDGHGSGNGNGTGSSQGGKGDLPSGLYVGSAANPANTSPVAGAAAAKASTSASPVNPKLLASAHPPPVASVPTRPLQPESSSKLSETERSVFGERKFYSLTLNMPNLNSQGGSWIIRFAELRDNSHTSSGKLSAPYATRKVDPGYPLELMRQNVTGTMILYAVIGADGTVRNIRVLRSVDDRLDQYASQAVSQWQFQPATKDGAPVDVEATFQIPFRTARPDF